MFRTRNFLAVFVAAAFVVALSLAGLAESDACAGDWKCWFIVPFKILFSKYDPPANANWLRYCRIGVQKLHLPFVGHTVEYDNFSRPWLPTEPWVLLSIGSLLHRAVLATWLPV
jgi:hypothetical protein